MNDSNLGEPLHEVLVSMIEEAYQADAICGVDTIIEALRRGDVPEEVKPDFVKRLLAPWKDNFQGHPGFWPQWVDDPGDDLITSLRGLIESWGGECPPYPNNPHGPNKH